MNPSESLELIQQSKRTVSGQYQVSNIGLQEDKCLEIASYKEISQFKSMRIISFHLFNIAHSSYIMLIQIDEQFQRLFCIYDLDQQIIIQSDIIKLGYIDSVATNKNFLYIIGRQRIIQICLINQRFNFKKQYICKKQNYKKKIKFLNDGQNLILEGTNNTIRLRSLNLQKQIFKLKSDYKNVEYNSRNLILIQLKQNGYQQFINIVNIQNRQIVARQNFDPQFKIIQIIQIQDTNDLLIQFQYQGLFLKRINYLTKNIESIKRLSYSHRQICIFDDNNMSNLMSIMFYIRYDRQYNIIQRFKISQDFKEGYFQELLLEGFSNVRLKQKLPQILGLKQYEKYSFYQQAINNAQKTQKNGFCFSECNTLYFEYLKYSYSQHIISQDSKYFTFIFRKSLIFHYVQNKCDLQVDFNKQIRFINLSQSSNYLYVVLGDKRGGFLGERFNTYKTKQNLKRCNQRFDNLNRLLTQQAGLMVGINSQGNASAYSKTSGKLIFKQKTKHCYSTFDYQNGIILISNYDEIFLYNLSNRTQHLTLQQLNLQTKLIPNSSRFLILQQSGELQLWCCEHQPPYFERIIMNEVKTIFQGYQNIIYLRKFDSIVILNQNWYCNMQEMLIQNDQILSEKLILRLDFHQVNDALHPDSRQIILSLESI